MSDLCKSKITGLRLKGFNEIEAIREISNTWATRKKALMRYSCKNCLKWHVIEEDLLQIGIVNNCIKCHTSNRKLKRTYSNSVEAGKAGGKLTINLGIFHRTYPCPYGFGWHVTSEQQKHYRYIVELTEESIKKKPGLTDKIIESKQIGETAISTKKEWTKTTYGLKNNRTGLFISFSITLRDLIPCPGYTVKSGIVNLVKFIKDSDIENP
jgi:hypothetical protein